MLDCLAQIGFEGATRIGALVHLALEKAISAAAIGLDAVQCEVGVLQKLVRLRAVARRERDADAGVDGKLVTVDHHRLANGVADAPGEFDDVGGAHDRGLNDGELVAPKPGNDVARPHHGAQASGNDVEQFVAGRMTKGVVDILELVEIEIENRKVRAGAKLVQHAFELLAEQHAIRQVRQRIVVRKVCDLLLGALLLGDVFQRCDPAAVGERLIDNLN